MLRLPKPAARAVDFGLELAREFKADNSGLMAAAVSFYTFLSLVPLLLLAVAIFGFILKSQDQAFQALMRNLSAYAPEGVDTRGLLEGVVGGSKAATGVGAVALLWAGSQAFVNLEKIINMAWDLRPRGFIEGRLVAFVLVICVGGLLFLSFGITTVASAIRASDNTLFGHTISELLGWARSPMAFFLPLIFSIATFTLIFWMLPNKRTPFVPTLAGGAVAGVLWEAASYVFSWYLTHFANYSKVYGSLAGIILLLIWIYYSSTVTIVGAQFSAIYARRRETRYR